MTKMLNEDYVYNLQQGYRVGNAYATTIVGASYLQPQYIFSNPSPKIKCNIKQPFAADKNLNPGILPYEEQLNGIKIACEREH